ncbi:methylated-DNA--[protein]-cysteine S-methyltransferase [Emcibacter sp. SYSU 3D8]|uniref:methylated-DNA--[protein]-cysteine S-methyltransferase n=1 Tax=Emcibacter sp. SYSU 3D8 TaxID=3133969 RepID=UPI0031FE7420
MTQLSLHSPVGDLTVSEDDGAIVSLDWGWGAVQTETPLLLEARRQLHLYFDGDLTQFNLNLRPHGTPFRHRVWTAMRKIPYGKTETYGSVAGQLQSASRAVGGACGANPIPILIPCHRILAAGGGLGGYSGEGGTETKMFLLRLERALP